MTRVLFTGPEDSLAGLEAACSVAGFILERRAMLRFEQPADWTALDGALARLDRFGAIALTSPRAAAALASRLTSLPCRVPAWVTGPTTASALGGRVTPVHTVAVSGTGDAARAVADAIIASGLNAPVLFPCGDQGRDALVSRLEAAGLPVLPVTCYHTVLAGPEAARRCCRDAEVLVVTSPSVARLLADNRDPGCGPALVVLGQVTAAGARQAGWVPDAIASEPTVAGVVAAIARIVRAAPSQT